MPVISTNFEKVMSDWTMELLIANSIWQKWGSDFSKSIWVEDIQLSYWSDKILEALASGLIGIFVFLDWESVW